MQAAEQTEKDIDLTRAEYVPVAVNTQISLLLCLGFSQYRSNVSIFTRMVYQYLFELVFKVHHVQVR